MVVCPHCGEASPEGFRFCGRCGQPVGPSGAARVERKVITALFCDLVGSTALGERLDPEDLQALLSRYHGRVRDEVERFSGSVEKFIGDGVAALFGAPLAHEDDPERAVRAALAVKEWAAQEPGLHVRVAVTTGEALVSLDARAARGDHAASGDVLNTASRLQAAAPVDGILVGEQTYRATERAIEYREHEPVVAKGKSEPVPVWEVVRARSAFGVDVETVPTTALVGRERELRLLGDALERAHEEREPQLVTLVGVPGIGKSRVVYELWRIAEANSGPLVWRRGRCLPYGDGVSFWALGRIVKAQAGILESDAAETVDAKLAASVADLVSAADADWVLRWLRPLVGGSSTERSGGARAESFPAWRRFLEAVAERGPTVLVFEDLHWAEEGLLDFLDDLTEWTTGVPLLVVCTARPELLAKRPGWGGGRANTLTLSLSPLSVAETSRLVHRLIERALLPGQLQEALLERAGGIPLYAEEFARMVAERGTAGLSVPESVQGIVASRLDALAPEDKRLLQDAAVVGTVFWTSAVSALAASERGDLERGLRELVRRELVRRERRSSVEGQSEYAFRHQLIRDVAYAQIPRAERSDRHRRTAEWIGSLGRAEDHAELLAHHYLEAIAYGRASGTDVSVFAKPALAALREAGERAMELSAYRSAARYFKAGLELLSEEGEERAMWLYRSGAALCWGENRGESELEEAVTRLRPFDRETAARAALLLAHLEWSHGDGAAMESWLAEVDDLLASLPESIVRTEALVMRSGVARTASENELAINLAQQALGRMDGLDRPDLLARSFSVIGTSRVFLGDEDGLADQRRAVAIARDGRAIFELNRALNHYPSLVQLGRLKDLEANLGERRRALEEFGGTADARVHLLSAGAEADFFAGRWADAIDGIEGVLGELERGVGHFLESAFRSIRALINLAGDRLPEALADINQAVAVAVRSGEPQVLAPSLCFRAWILLADDQPAPAREDFNELLALEQDRLAAGLNTQAAMPLFTWLAVDLRREPDAKTVIAHTNSRRWTAVSEAILADDNATAADLLAEIGHRPSEAYARLRADDTQLELALAFYRAVGATRYIRQAESSPAPLP